MKVIFRRNDYAFSIVEREDGALILKLDTCENVLSRKDVRFYIDLYEGLGYETYVEISPDIPSVETLDSVLHRTKGTKLINIMYNNYTCRFYRDGIEKIPSDNGFLRFWFYAGYSRSPVVECGTFRMYYGDVKLTPLTHGESVYENSSEVLIFLRGDIETKE